MSYYHYRQQGTTMTRTLNMQHLRRWMLISLLVLGVLAAAPHARAQQMTSDFEADVALIHNGISATVTATEKNDVASVKVNMENLYRLWRQFRQRNIDGQPQNPQFAPTLLKAEERLYAASLQVDQEKLPAARLDLEEARKLLNSLRPQSGESQN